VSVTFRSPHRYLLLAALGWGGLAAAATPTLQGELNALRELLAEGYYALAAQVEGPRVVEAFPESLEAHLLYARALLLVGNPDAAGEVLSDLGSTSQRPDALHLNALVRAAQGDTEGATELLRAAFEASPSYDVAMDWGQVAWQGGHLEEAERAYRAATTTPEGQREPWPTLNVARLQLVQGRFGEAIESLNATLDLLENDTALLPSPAYIEAFYRLGEAHEALGDLEGAVSHYQAARSVDPDFAPAREALQRLGSP
jgi:tetratricopeptide (TPR) repeat protein